MNLDIRQAHLAELVAISAILSEAASWLIEQGNSLWELSEFTAQAIEGDVRDGAYYLACYGNEPVGTLSVQSEDSLT